MISRKSGTWIFGRLRRSGVFGVVSLRLRRGAVPLGRTERRVALVERREIALERCGDHQKLSRGEAKVVARVVCTVDARHTAFTTALTRSPCEPSARFGDEI